ncbi:MAG: lamin tail domain-containing protein [Bacteroidia bacterium]|nr:lamin tail domain-containing protein [Bacteroidia bacterium]
MNQQKYKFKFSWLSKLTLALSYLLTLTAIPLSAQVQDDFSDGNFTENPTWIGDVNKFLISADGMLQSNGDSLSGSSNTVYLVTEGALFTNTQWEFFVNPKMSTSSNNLMDVYLMSDSFNLKGPLNGYFVRIGGTPDEVALFRRDGLTETKIINGVQGSINGTSTNPTRVKVIRTSAGQWTLYADYDGSGTAYELVGITSDIAYSEALFCGLIVRYSNSNRSKFFFDDLSIGPEILDTIAPQLLEVNVLNSQELELVFSENLDPATAANTENFDVNNSIGEPGSASRNAIRHNVVNLHFNTAFPEALTLTLSCTGIKDLAGNSMIITQLPFLYYKAKPFDIVINEIMADPDPPVQLPNVEYIELYNRSAYPVNLQNWTIQAGTNFKLIAAAKILPDSFIVLTSFVGEALYKDSIAVSGVVAFPSLTNTGAALSLIDPSGTIISAVSYADAWYGNTAKKDGGWALEQISPLKPCEGAANWTASTNARGGTPGARNSVWNPAPDTIVPKIDRVAVISPDTIRVFFTENVLAEDLADSSAYLIDQSIGHPAKVFPEGPAFNTAKLLLPTPLQVGLLYTISLEKPVRDCLGNPSPISSNAKFAIPSVCLPNDIIINEILSDPKSGGVDYIELYNRSQKIIDLASLQLGSKDTLSGTLTASVQLAPKGYLCFPGQYLLVSTSLSGITPFYTVPPDVAFIQVPSLAAYNNESGVVTLSTIANQVQIDQVVYRSDMHFAFLNSLDGVSLERVNYNRPSNDRTNWNSAASTVNYGTPGYRNSQFSEISGQNNATLTVNPEVFSPDNDGFDDVVTFNYEFTEPGFTASLYIYDANGRLVNTITRNMLMGTSGQLSWNGIQDDSGKARVGIYIVFLEGFTLDGKTIAVKKPFVLGGKL